MNFSRGFTRSFFIVLAVSLTCFGLPRHIEFVTHTTLPEKIESSNKNTFIFDPNNLQWAVYNQKGERVGIGKGVGGKDFCPDINRPCRTIEGTYAVYRIENEDCTSKTFPIGEGGGAPMPHCMFFHKGYAIHGSNLLPDENASHGCIRVTKPAAQWMNENYLKPGALVKVLPYRT